MSPAQAAHAGPRLTRTCANARPPREPAPADGWRLCRYFEPGALEFLARLRVAAGTRMLDVGCGAGQVAIPAAHAGVRVTGVDTATHSSGQARARAHAEGVDVRSEEGDAEALDFPDASFDLVVSLISAMLAPQPELVSAELIRFAGRRAVS